MEVVGRDQLQARWHELLQVPAGLKGSALAGWKRGRGYELEKLIFELARLEQLDAAPAYRGSGEQIDGYFMVGHRHFLLEAKWQKDPVTASEVFAFQGKLRGTLGLFVSVNGFADDAPSALVFGKEIDVVLADRSDIELAFGPAHTFEEMVRVKMRAAARTGAVYYTYQRWLDASP
jgi:hypothetical protein